MAGHMPDDILRDVRTFSFIAMYMSRTIARLVVLFSHGFVSLAMI